MVEENRSWHEDSEFREKLEEKKRKEEEEAKKLEEEKKKKAATKSSSTSSKQRKKSDGADRRKNDLQKPTGELFTFFLRAIFSRRSFQCCTTCNEIILEHVINCTLKEETFAGRNFRVFADFGLFRESFFREIFQYLSSAKVYSREIFKISKPRKIFYEF